LAKSTSSLPLLVASSVANPQTWCEVVKVAAGDPAAGGRLGACPQAGPQPVVAAFQRVFGTQGCGGCCAAFFLFCLAFVGFTAVRGALFSNTRPFGCGPGLSATAFLGSGPWVATLARAP